MTGHDAVSVTTVVAVDPETAFELFTAEVDADFAPGERTEVEVRFQRVAGGTQVALEHRGWDKLRRDHPARHGLEGSAFTSMVGLWWAEQLTFLRTHGAHR